MYRINRESGSQQGRKMWTRLAAFGLLLIAGMIGLFVFLFVLLVLLGELEFDEISLLILLWFGSVAYLCMRFARQLSRSGSEQAAVLPDTKYAVAKLGIGSVVWGSLAILMLIAAMLDSTPEDSAVVALCLSCTVLFGTAAYQNIRLLHRRNSERKRAEILLGETKPAEISVLGLSLRFAGSLLYSFGTVAIWVLLYHVWQQGSFLWAVDGVLGGALLVLSGVLSVYGCKSWQHFLRMFQHYADQQKKW